ncbi:hypothetical protein [Halovenus sp. HT40]|uniref:hypothetical protein n=1 Tax=Halovenus sp. HT40 TaxID=3126691 RepID=UPI00300F507B
MSRENIIILAGALGAVGSLFLFGVVGTVVDTPGQWGSVIAFVLLVGFGFVLPQLYLMRTDAAVSNTARLGVITVIMLILGPGFAAEVDGIESKAISGVVVLSILFVVTHQLREGYRQSIRNDTQ